MRDEVHTANRELGAALAPVRPNEFGKSRSEISDRARFGISTPESSWPDRLFALLIIGSSALYFGFFYRVSLLNSDEGIVLQGAQRILEGQLLYRDFFAFVTPGSYYWTALFFKAFGSSILVARGVLLTECALLSSLVYLLARRVCSRWISLFSAALFTLTGPPNRFLVLHNWDSTFWASVTLYCAVLFLQNPRRPYIFATGWFAATTCLFEQSKGAGLILGLILAAALLAAANRSFASHWKATFARTAAVGFSSPFILTAAYFAVQGGLRQMAAGWFWPLHNYSLVNGTPYGFVILTAQNREAIYSGAFTSRLLTAFFTAPWLVIPALPLISVVVLIYLAWKRRSQHDQAEAYFIVISSVVIGLLSSSFATKRPDFTHLMYMSPILFVTLAWWMDGLFMPAWLRRITPLLNFALLISFAGFGLGLLSIAVNADTAVQTRRGNLKAGHPDQIIDYIDRNVPAGATIVVYPYLPLYYYLTETRSPGRYEYLMPGFHTPEQFHEFVDELRDARTEMVFFQPGFRESIIPAFPAASPSILSEPDPVESYIKSHYRKCADLTSQNFLQFEAMARNDVACP